MGFPSKQNVQRMGEPPAESHVRDVACMFQRLPSSPGDKLVGIFALEQDMCLVFYQLCYN